jgi:NAD(P)-dependent dehydrogenase (short-subunit alcohol dehydrogenase family)
VTSEQNWAQVVDAVMAAHGRLDILFNNAGVSFPAKSPRYLVALFAALCVIRVKFLLRSNTHRKVNNANNAKGRK